MRRFAFIVVVGLLVACGREPSPPPATAQPAPSAPSAPRAPSAPVTAAKPRIVFLGDSLTAGLGLPSDQSYPSLIGQRLKERGYDYEVINAGVSGDTSAGGFRRLDWSLEGDVRILVIALGGNDGLRGLGIREMKKNLAQTIERARSKKIAVVLAGMEAPPSNGPDYAKGFRDVYRELAVEYDVPLIPFLLQGVAGDASLNQADGIHPNVRGAAIVADLVWKELEPMLRRPNQ